MRELFGWKVKKNKTNKYFSKKILWIEVFSRATFIIVLVSFALMLIRYCLIALMALDV